SGSKRHTRTHPERARVFTTAPDGREAQFSLTAIPFLVSSSRASRALWRSAQPMPSSTACCLVNWIFAYSSFFTRMHFYSLYSILLMVMDITPLFTTYVSVFNLCIIYSTN